MSASGPVGDPPRAGLVSVADSRRCRPKAQHTWIVMGMQSACWGRRKRDWQQHHDVVSEKPSSPPRLENLGSFRAPTDS